MQARPQKLDEFAAFYAQYAGTVAGKEALEKNHSVVLSMYEMLQEYGGKVPPSDQVRYPVALHQGDVSPLDHV